MSCPRTHADWFGGSIGVSDARSYRLETRQAWSSAAMACREILSECLEKFEAGTTRGDYSRKLLSRLDDKLKEVECG